MVELFDYKYGELVPKFDLIGDTSILIGVINEFDEETEKTLTTGEITYGYSFCFEQLVYFARYYPNFICSSLPEKQGRILQYFFSLDYKEAERQDRERYLRNTGRKIW